MTERKHFIDNIRWITVVIVIIYHIIYMFNCSGIIKNIAVDGIPWLDGYLVFVYPWFMCLLFLIAGISSRYSLQKRTYKEFLKDRTKRILIPSIIGIFAYGWIMGIITSQYTDIFAANGDKVPGLIKYLIYCLMGIGPLWFAHMLFLFCILLAIIRIIDKNDMIFNLCGKINFPILFLLVLAVWGSSLIFNTPLINVYRFGIYTFMFFLGYFVFSHEEVIEKLKKISIPLGIVSLIVGIVYVALNYGKNYADNSILETFFTNAYLWITILAILGLGKRFLNFDCKFSRYMTGNNFNFYVLHYPVAVSISYFTVEYLSLPFALNYVVILLGTSIFLPLITELIKRIPIARNLILGIYKKK